MSKKVNQKKKSGLILVFIAIFTGVGSYLLINSFASVTPTNFGFETSNDPKCTGGINTTAGNTSFTQDASKKYEGNYSAKASFSGGTENAYARCVVTTSWVTGDEVWYGGAFFLPSGFTQSMQNQVDLMRWDNFSLNNTSQDWGGIIIQNSDKQARLKRFNASGDYTDISTPFTFPENRWVWVEVHQKFSPTNGQAINEVYLDGVLQSSSTTANTYGREITRIRYGLVAIGAGSQTNPLNLWVDRATISSSKVGPLTTSSTALTGDTNGDGVVNIVDLSTLLSRWNTNFPAADFNQDLTVNIIDLSILLSNYGKSSPPPTDPVPLGVGGTWNLKFSDEFNGTSIDLNKWRPNWLAGNDTAITKPVNDAELSCYDPKQVSVAGGVLSLSAVAKSCTANNGVTYNYASGLIESYGHYEFTYGYMEAKMKIPGTTVPVNWPAFWANGTGNWPTTGEIDVMEVLGGSQPICWHFHYSGGAPGGCVNLTPADTGWHTFGANWEPGKITYYYNGTQVGQVTSGVTSAPMYIIANMGLSNTYGGPVTVPTKSEVDYIRVWQR